MKWPLIALIRVYWKAVPEHKRRNCLFYESCSMHVHRIALREGFIPAIKALKKRRSQCRPGYTLYIQNNAFELHLRNGDIIPEKEIASHILPLFRTFDTERAEK